MLLVEEGYIYIQSFTGLARTDTVTDTGVCVRTVRVCVCVCTVRVCVCVLCVGV